MPTGRDGRRLRVPRRIRRLQARKRLRQINARRVARALQTPVEVPSPRRPAAAPAAPTTYGAPRSLLYLTVKRNNTSWRALYGHWWVEVDDEASYGWWPASVPLRARDLVRGTGGVLNGVGLLGMNGSWSRDPNHGQPAVHAFHPVLAVVKSDDQLRHEIRRFAHSYRTRWRWHWSSRRHVGTCRGFQDDLFAAVSLTDGAGQVHTRGSGCPFLFQARRPWWWVADRLDHLRTLRGTAPPASVRPGPSACAGAGDSRPGVGPDRAPRSDGTSQHRGRQEVSR